jgi:hypothetical protein
LTPLAPNVELQIEIQKGILLTFEKFSSIQDHQGAKFLPQ